MSEQQQSEISRWFLYFLLATYLFGGAAFSLGIIRSPRS